MSSKLTTTDHSRKAAGLKYIYPVISRRSGGLSIGVNFNINNACNWRCVYCQVPDLIRGAPPRLNLDLLKKEISLLLNDVLHGDFFDRFGIEKDQRVIKDVAISGNGEPTSLKEFEHAIILLGEIVSEVNQHSRINYVLITNGSLIHQHNVQQGLRQLNKYHGEVWFKLDCAGKNRRVQINGAAIAEQKYFENIICSANLCPTWIQTCVFKLDGQSSITDQEKKAYLDLLRRVKNEAVIRGILLYTIARSSQQPEAERLSKLPEVELEAFADEIRELGFNVKVSS